MTQPPNDLASLISRVEAAGGPDREIDALIHCLFPREWELSLNTTWRPGYVTARYQNGKHGTYGAGAYTRSVDTALSLISRVLDVWCIVSESTPKSDHPSGNKACAQIMLMGGGGTDRIAHKTPVLALILAMLRAVEARALLPQISLARGEGLEASRATGGDRG